MRIAISTLLLTLLCGCAYDQMDTLHRPWISQSQISAYTDKAFKELSTSSTFGLWKYNGEPISYSMEKKSQSERLIIRIPTSRPDNISFSYFVFDIKSGELAYSWREVIRP